MRTALITGATSGLGRAIAMRLSESGYRVLALGRNAAALDELREIPGMKPIAAEITDRELLAEIVAAHEIDVLVNNVGIMPPLKSFHDMDWDDLDRIIRVNFQASVELTRLVAPVMVARRRGHIFFTGSTAGHAPFPNMALYCATKAAIGAFAQALFLDLAPHGVRVCEIVAGRVETNLYRDIVSDAARDAMYAGGTAVQPQEVAEMVDAVLRLPPSATVSRFDIVPTRQGSAPQSTGQGDAQ